MARLSLILTGLLLTAAVLHLARHFRYVDEFWRGVIGLVGLVASLVLLPVADRLQAFLERPGFSTEERAVLCSALAGIALVLWWRLL